MNILKLAIILGLTFGSLVQTTIAAPVLDRGTSVNVVLANTVQLGGGSSPVVFRVVSPSLLSSARLEGQFNQNSKSWVMVEFERFVMPNGAEVPLGKVEGSDFYGTQSIEVLQSHRSEWAAYLGKSNIPSGTHFSMMLTAKLEIPSFTKASLALAR